MVEDLVLSPELLLSAYSQGVFPMADEDGTIYWYDPDPRAIIPFDRFHISRSLARTLQKQRFDIRINTAFTAVIEACAAPAPGREKSWINDQIIRAYSKLNQLGFAHSVEAWCGGKLVGGLYGVTLRGLFAGESMFSHEPDASKVALVYLVKRLQERNYHLLDVQFLTDHLRQFGAIEISSDVYKGMLGLAMKRRTQFI